MRFWRLHHPEYSDYEQSYINGSLEHPFGLPGVDCDVCGATWGGSRILPLECPRSLRSRKQLTERWPIPLREHQSLQHEIYEAFRGTGQTVSDLQPGDDFQPCYLDIPSYPRDDFLWACLGSVVVSASIRQLFESLRIEDVSYSVVAFRRVGQGDARDPAPISSTGEPEEIINEVPLLADTACVGRYFELIIHSESGYAPGGEPLSVCSACGLESFPDHEARLVMLASMWKGKDIFFLAGTRYIIVTERVRRALEEFGASNVRFHSIPDQPKKLRFTKLQRDVIQLLAEAGEETLSKLQARLNPSEQRTLERAIEWLERIGFVQRTKREGDMLVTLTARGANAQDLSR
jgi:hypothetical protein